MSPWRGMDRRRFPRVNYPCLIIIRHEQEDKDIILSHTENLGIGGVCITLKKNLKMFSSVAIELDLLDFGDHIKCQGKVVWSIRRRDDESKKPSFYDIGIEFNKLGDKDQQRLNAAVERLAKQNKGAITP